MEPPRENPYASPRLIPQSQKGRWLWRLPTIPRVVPDVALGISCSGIVVWWAAILDLLCSHYFLWWTGIHNGWVIQYMGIGSLFLGTLGGVVCLLCGRALHRFAVLVLALPYVSALAYVVPLVYLKLQRLIAG